jgi:hypothetical protein
MPYTRVPTWPENPNRRDDYVIRHDGRDVGRVYLTRLLDGDAFVWTIYMNGHVPQVPSVPISGSAATLDEAAVAFKRSHERMREAAGLPKP